jgi:hypothetical protein
MGLIMGSKTLYRFNFFLGVKGTENSTMPGRAGSEGLMVAMA